MSATAFDLPEIERRLARFLAAQGLEAVKVEELRRFTVGFSWITFGFHARWREAAEERERRMILRLGPPNGIFAPYRASPEFVTLRALQGHGVPVPEVHWHSDASERLRGSVHHLRTSCAAKRQFPGRRTAVPPSTNRRA